MTDLLMPAKPPIASSGIAGAKDLLKRASILGSRSVLLAFSGGKDSLVCADLLLSSGMFDRVEGYFMYFVPGLQCIEPKVDALAARLGIKLHKIPHMMLFSYFRDGYHMPVLAGTENLKSARMVDLEQYLRQKTGIDLVAVGWRRVDSMQRRAYLNRCNGLDPKTRRLYPIWDWQTGDVVAYLRAKKLSPVVLNPTKRKMSDVGLNLDFLRWVQVQYPDDYRKILAVYPFVEAVVARNGFKTETEKTNQQGTSGNTSVARFGKAPTFHGETDSPVPIEERAIQPTQN